jgi:hypothetical protein
VSHHRRRVEMIAVVMRHEDEIDTAERTGRPLER